MKKIFVSVSNDVYGDNRVKKTCRSLSNYGLEVHLLCKYSPACADAESDFYRLLPLKCFFKKNVFFYAEFNLRLFFSLLFKPIDVLWANDLDTLLALFVVSKLRRKPLIFDSHELFTQVAELNYNPFAKKVWTLIERSILPKLKYVVTVCQPIKEYFKNKYNIEAAVVRNIPLYKEENQQPKHYPLEEKFIVWQGATNIDRSLEDLVTAMKDVDAKLYIMGQGDVLNSLRRQVKENHLKEKVIITGRLNFEQMMTYTRKASLGLSLDRPTNKNYEISLPNKIFEYINSATPILATPLCEIRNIVETYEVGEFIEEPTPKNIAKRINELLSDENKLQRLSDNCLKAQKELSWQREEKSVFDILDKIFQSQKVD
ncbi:MAG: glycosyltransferase [Bacteroidales bacterium]|nr:glycosyltransferase [Bacteroidales bacterium]